MMKSLSGLLQNIKGVKTKEEKPQSKGMFKKAI